MHLRDLYTESGQTLQGSFSAVSTPIFASKYALESSRRDLHNALLCTVLNAQNFRQKSLKILLIFSPNFGEFDKFSLVFAQILPDFCRIFAIRPRRNVQGTGRVPGGYPGGSPQFAFSRKLPHTAPPKKLASSSARPAAALRDVCVGFQYAVEFGGCVGDKRLTPCRHKEVRGAHP